MVIDIILWVVIVFLLIAWGVSRDELKTTESWSKHWENLYFDECRHVRDVNTALRNAGLEIAGVEATPKYKIVKIKK